MKFGCFGGMVVGVLRVPMGRMCVMCGGFVIARLVVFRSVAMMLRRVGVVLGCFMMVLGCLFRHICPPPLHKWVQRA